MSEFNFTKDQARTFLLLAQGFGQTFETNSVETVEKCISGMGVLQIDTIHIVARSPYLVLWSRLGDYSPDLLDQLQTEGKLFEYWSHEACYIPIKDFGLYRRLMIEQRKHPGRFAWLDENRGAVEAMLQHIQINGATRSSDFQRSDGKKGNWWNWKSEKVTLDFLHTSGELMIARREKFHRIYDLRERILPSWDDDHAPTYEEVLSSLVLKSVHCLGVACARWCADYFRLPKKDVLRHLLLLEEKGAIKQAQIEGLEGHAYLSTDQIHLAERVLQPGFSLDLATLLSPFDPIVWDRKRAQELFDFDYRIECYVPELKRKFGYFVLPLLVGNRIVGRLDAKAHRKEKLFEIKSLYLEHDVKVDGSLIASIAVAIKKCAEWHQTPDVRIIQADRPHLAKQIESASKVVVR